MRLYDYVAEMITITLILAKDLPSDDPFEGTKEDADWQLRLNLFSMLLFTFFTFTQKN